MKVCGCAEKLNERVLTTSTGTYILKEDLHLATPPPHPSEAPIINPNPLATTPQPATAGTKISLLNLSSRPLIPQTLYKIDTNRSANGANPSIQEHPNEGRASGEVAPSSDGGDTSVTGSARAALSIGSAPAFGEGNLMLVPTGKDAGKDTGKRRKPKNNIAKSNSSFISRCIVHENLTKRLQDRPTDGLFAFANIIRAFQWLDLSSSQKVEFRWRARFRALLICGQAEHLTKILFTKGHCLCHDINELTKSPSHIDLIMGFSTGEIIWFEPISQKYTRLNKNVGLSSRGLVNGR